MKKGFSLKNLFVYNEDEESESVQPKVEKVVELQPKDIVVETPKSTRTGINDEILNSLVKTIEKNNQPGFDYFEFSQALKLQEKNLISESVRFETVFSTVQVMGITGKGLISSAQKYIGNLEAQKQEFETVLAHQTDENISKPEREIGNIEERIINHEKEIERLKQEVVALKERKNELIVNIAEQTVKINNVKSEFENTYSYVVEKIEEDISKIKKYIIKED